MLFYKNTKSKHGNEMYRYYCKVLIIQL